MVRLYSRPLPHMTNKFILSAENLARTHDFQHDLLYKHTCLLVRGGSILSVGFNTAKVNGFVHHLCRTLPCDNPHSNTHAEVAAILSARNKVDLTGSKAYVVRIKEHGLGLSKPCLRCQEAVRR